MARGRAQHHTDRRPEPDCPTRCRRPRRPQEGELSPDDVVEVEKQLEVGNAITVGIRPWR
jgi:hypothetical protein